MRTRGAQLGRLSVQQFDERGARKWQRTLDGFAAADIDRAALPGCARVWRRRERARVGASGGESGAAAQRDIPRALGGIDDAPALLAPRCATDAQAAAASAEAMALLDHARQLMAAHADGASAVCTALFDGYLAEALVNDAGPERAREPMQTAAAFFRDKLENAPQRTLANVVHARFLSGCG